jgi:putative DNA primase/helicase
MVDQVVKRINPRVSKSRRKPAQMARAIDDPDALAESFRKSQKALGLLHWQGGFHRWQGGHYQPWPEADVRNILHRHCSGTFSNYATESQKIPKKVTVPLINNVLAALRSICHQDHSTPSPSWLNGHDGPDLRDCVAVANGLLYLPERTFYRATPNLFTTTASPVSYNQRAKPEVWTRFLGSLWPDDPESILLLQMWFGYCLTSDTRQQKILLMIGPPRSGKGTICKALEGLIGGRSYGAIDPTKLGNDFGLAPLKGKSVACIADLRVSHKADHAAIVKSLLSISGEDTVAVNEKYQDEVSLRLRARLMMVSNEVPRLVDASGALADRLIVLKLAQSFLGREDNQLERKVLAELPGVLNWAVEGWQRLQQQGRFLQPASGVSVLNTFRDSGSDVGCFLRECCVLEPTARIPCCELYAAWESYCKRNNKGNAGRPNDFARLLYAAAAGVTEGPRMGPRSQRQRCYDGIRLNRSLE